MQYSEKASVPDLKPETVAELQDQLAATFGGDAKVEVTAPAGQDAGAGGALAVEITLPDRVVNSEIRVAPAGTAATTATARPKRRSCRFR